MKKTFTLFAVLVSSICSFSQSIDSLMGPRVWLSADRSELTSTGWADLSLYENHAAAESPLVIPSAYDVINFNKSLVFDGIDDYLKIPYSLGGLPELSILAVYQSSDTIERGIWGAGESSRKVLLTTRRAIGPDTVSDAYGKKERITVLNSIMQNWPDAGVSVADGFLALGSAGDGSYKSFKGSIAEILVFNRSLSFLERVQYETYLAIKYGTGLRGGNFVSSGEKVLWHVEKNQNYGRNIAGIGRDDAFKLIQKQSGSAYDSGLLVVAAGKLSPSNVENLATINDQDFILWGDNGLPLATKPGEGPDSLLSIVERKWLITATGNTANKLPTELHIAANKLPVEPMSYWLVIDRSGRGNFSADNLEYILPEKIDNGKIIYKNVLWDIDGSGKDHFGFARAKNLFAVVRKLSDPSCTDETAGQVRIEVISGKAPYHFALYDEKEQIRRDWKESNTFMVQKDLVGGEYTLTLKDGSKEWLSRSFELAVPDALHISLGPDQELSEEAIALDVSAQVPDSVNVNYRWENSFGFSSTDQRITAREAGIYRVFVTKEADGCVFTDDVAITGAEDQTIAVYPTILSSNENFNVSLSLEEAASVIVKVYNAKGVIIDEMQGAFHSEYQFIRRIKDSGIFLVVIQTPKGMETRKIIVH